MLKRAIRFVVLACLMPLRETDSAQALTFNVTYDASTASAPAAFFTALGYSFQYYQALYNDPITINVHVGWGDINGNPLGAGLLGQSLTVQQGNFTYAQIRTALLNDAKTPDDAASVSTLPVGDPTGGRSFVMSNAEAKALGLLSGTATGTDGYVGFNKTAAWTFDPNHRAQAGQFDFLGTAHHEITEVMGRYGYGQNGGGSRDSPIDLFRYFSAGVHDFTPTFSGDNSTANYFSIDSGSTNLHSFNVVCCGDLSDWASGANDSYNAFSASGAKNPTSLGDRVLVDVLGYDRVPFTNDPLIVTTSVIKAVHITELRARIDQLRARHGLGAYAYSRPITAGLIVEASDILQMRTALNDVFIAAGMPLPPYTTTPGPGVQIRVPDVSDLRAAVHAIEEG